MIYPIFFTWLIIALLSSAIYHRKVVLADIATLDDDPNDVARDFDDVIYVNFGQNKKVKMRYETYVEFGIEQMDRKQRREWFKKFAEPMAKSLKAQSTPPTLPVSATLTV